MDVIGKEAFEWSREKIKEVLETLSHLPDFDQLPFPDSWAKEFDIPITEAKCNDLRSFMAKNRSIRMMNLEAKQNDLKDQNIREVPSAEPLTLTVQTVSDIQGQPFGVSVPPIEHTGTEQQENQESPSTDVPPLQSDV